MDDLLFNPMDPAFVADPYPTYRRLRAEDPVHQSPLGFWVLTRYEDVAAALRDPRLAKEAIPAFVAARFGLAAGGAGPVDARPGSPDHTRLRGLVSKAFTPRVVDVLRPTSSRSSMACSTASRTRADGPHRGLRLPPARHRHLRDARRAARGPRAVQDVGLDIARGLDAIWLPPDSDVTKRSFAARHELADYFRDLIARRRAQPRSDMLSGLIAAEEAGDKLNEEELLATCILLLVAGHETTVNLIGNGTLALLRHPAQLHRLQEDPGLMVTAVEELLRFDGPVQRTARIPSEDVTIGGRIIPKGELVMPFIGAADRDPAQFPDPERLDITRTDNRHIAFGWGIHFCLGAPLARVEGQIAIGTLVRRLPNLRLATEAPAFRQSLTLRGLSALPSASTRVLHHLSLPVRFHCKLSAGKQPNDGTGRRPWTSGRRSSSRTIRWGRSELGRALEARGFESLWAPEHSHIPLSRRSPFPQGGDLPKKYYDVMDPFVTLSAAAAATTRLRVGTGICLVVQRDPIQTAKEVASLDQVSGGRFLFGIGAGWNAEEMADHGTEFGSRFKVMQERVEAMRAIWTKSKPEYSGEHVRFPPMMTWPKPAQKPHPPVIVGGAYPYGARRAIAYGDGWLPHARRPAYGDVLGLLPDFRKMAVEAGRDPASLPITVFGVAEDLDLIKRYRDAGVARLIFNVPPAKADEVLPLLDRCAALMRQASA